MERTLRVELRKGHGAADWSTRPLPDAWLNYAALDVEVLLELRDAMEAELESQGKLEWAKEEFEYIRLAGPPKPKPDRWRRTSHITSLKTTRQLAAVRALWQAREDLARKRDVSPSRVLPDSAIIDAALKILGRWTRSARFPSSADHVNAVIRVSGWMHWKPRAGSPTASFRRKPRPSSGRPLPVAGPARIQRRLIG